MARPPTIQPEPLSSFSLSDGTIVEVRDGSCWEIHRGASMRMQFEKKRDKLCEWILDTYWDGNMSNFYVKNLDILKSANRFAKVIASSQHLPNGPHSFGVNCENDSALRRKYYPEVLGFFKACEQAIEKNT